MSQMIAKRILVTVAIGDFKKSETGGVAYVAAVLDDGQLFTLGGGMDGGTGPLARGGEWPSG